VYFVRKMLRFKKNAHMYIMGNSQKNTISKIKLNQTASDARHFIQDSFSNTVNKAIGMLRNVQGTC